jgi:hypothetical protein
MVFVEGDDYRQLRRPGDDPAQFRSVVRPAQTPDPPDSVEHQYTGDNFSASSWPDNIGQSPMSINGLSGGTLNGEASVISDGTDDFGVAPTGGPESLIEQPSFGIAFTFSSLDARSFTLWMGVISADDSLFDIGDGDFDDGSVGELRFSLRDQNKNAFIEETTDSFCNGNINLVVVNKEQVNGSPQVEFYINSMSSPVNSQTQRAQGFDLSNFSFNEGMGFFAQNTASGEAFFKEFNTGFIEFNSQSYTPKQRQDLKARVPEV